MSHYFVDDPNLRHEYTHFTYCMGDHDFYFTGDAGVFSRNQVDSASDLLIRTIPTLSGRLLDIGCGYGCIGIVLAKLYRLEVTLADINPRALVLAAANAKSNFVDAKTVQSDCFENINGMFDTVVTNPPIRAGKQVVFQMYQGALKHLKENGVLYVVIRDKHGADSTKKKLEELFVNCETTYKKKGYRVYKCVNRNPTS